MKSREQIRNGADTPNFRASFSRCQRYTDIRILRGKVCAVKQFNYTTAVVVGLDPVGFSVDIPTAPHRCSGRARGMGW